LVLVYHTVCKVTESAGNAVKRGLESGRYGAVIGIESHESTTFAWVESALEHTSTHGGRQFSYYLEALRDEVLFEMKLEVKSWRERQAKRANPGNRAAKVYTAPLPSVRSGTGSAMNPQ
jgi:hypothetical protein